MNSSPIQVFASKVAGFCYNPPAKYVIGQRVALCTRVNPLTNNAKYWPTHQVRSWLEHQGSSSAPQGWQVVSEIRNIQSSNAFLLIILLVYGPKADIFGAYLAKPPGSTVAPGSRREAARSLPIIISRWWTSTTNNSTNITNDKICLIQKLLDYFMRSCK